MQEPGVRSSVFRDSNPQITLRCFDKVSNPKSIHGIYPYRGKMSALDAAHVISQLPSTAVLLDPFCGTGTIVYEAQAHGMKAVGVDNNPLACVIARGKTEQVDVESVLANLVSAISDAQNQDDVRICLNVGIKPTDMTKDVCARAYTIINQLDKQVGATFTLDKFNRIINLVKEGSGTYTTDGPDVLTREDVLELREPIAPIEL